jgi:hypothetical protein
MLLSWRKIAITLKMPRQGGWPGYDSYPPNRRVQVRIETTLEAVDDG